MGIEQATDTGIFITFLILVISSTFVFPAILNSFDSLTYTTPQGIYDTIYSALEGNFLQDFAEWLLESIPVIGDIFEIFFDYSDALVYNFCVAWSNVPNALSAIILLPIFAGFTYSIIKLLPFT